MKLLAAAAALALALVGAAIAKGNPWPAAQKKVTYPVYNPAFTAGLTLAGFALQPCGAGRDPSVFASFGRGSSAKGFGHYRGFMLGEASPFQCSDFGDATRVGHRAVNGERAEVFAYCEPPGSKCPFTAGFAHGYVVRWHQPARTTGSLRKRTLITLISSRLTFAELLEIAAGLRPVR